MNAPVACYTCGSRVAASEKECCKMRRMTYTAGERQDNISFVYSSVKSILEKKLTCVKSKSIGRAVLPDQSRRLVDDLLDAADVRILKRIVNLRNKYY